MKKHILFSLKCLLLLLPFLVGGCRIAKNRPILTVPDKDKDRIEKTIFVGALEPKEEPKYWISKVTVVDTTFGYSSLYRMFEGSQSEAKVGYFEFTRDKLKFHNVVNRRSLEPNEIASQGLDEVINEWDIKHTQIRLVEEDGYPTNREEENKYIHWYEKSHFTIDWSQADISETSTFPYLYLEEECWKKKASRVVDTSRQFSEDYISFVIAVTYEQNPNPKKCSSLNRWKSLNFVQTVHHKYSFKSVPDPRVKNKDYTPYVYDGEQDTLLRKYGFFRTVRPAIAEEDGRDKNVFYMNRWNPNKKHTFYFTKDYPEEYKHIAHGVICHTNKLFAKNGLSNYPLTGQCTEDGHSLPKENETCTTGICFELKENPGHLEFGDIRYSFFHMLKAPHVSLLGYGPSDAHPATGEIIAGNVVTSTFYLDFYIKYFIDKFYKRDHETFYDKEQNQWVKDNQTKYETSSLFQKMQQTLKEDHPSWTKTSELIDVNSKIRPEFEFLVSKMTFGYPFWSNFTKVSSQNHFMTIGDHPTLDIPEETIAEANSVIQAYHTHLTEKLKHERNTTIYPLEPILDQIPGMVSNGMSEDEIKQRILFGLMTHEFGHVLNLRHNFYGSFDEKHWHKNEKDEVILKTSSVMDYLDIKDRPAVAAPLRALFGHYDEAALVYAYSGGQKDLSKEKNTQFLFCTDHHFPLNALCNRWDRGSTPSQVMMSLIESYEERYDIRNKRIGRAYWDTGGYRYWALATMMNIKRMLMLWRTALRDSYITQELDDSINDYTLDEVSYISHQIQKDLRQAIKLSIAFYNSVLQLSSADRDWRDSYERQSGSIERIGIYWDKFFAMYFLMGDDPILYNPNHYLDKATYLVYLNQLGFRQMLEEVMENVLTVRLDMENWFIDFARLLFTQNASNYHNLSLNGTLLEKIGVHCYTPEGLEKRFGIDPYDHTNHSHSPIRFLDTDVIDMRKWIRDIKDPYYKGTNEKLGITFFAGNYYVASSHLNKYAFTIFDQMRKRGGNPRILKQDIYDLFHLYHYFKKNGEIPECDNGE